MEERKTFSEQLREIRIAARMSQGELADKVGMYYHQIQRLENDNQLVKFSTVKKLEKALSCKFDLIAQEVFGGGKRVEHEPGVYDGLRKKIKALGPDEVIQFPGHAAMAQRIRIALRRDRETNKDLPAIKISHKVREGVICISPKAITMPWEGDEFEIKKVSSLPIKTPMLKGIKGEKYIALINRINSMGNGEVIMIDSDDAAKALILRSRIQEYKNQGRFKGNIKITRKKETISISKEK